MSSALVLYRKAVEQGFRDFLSDGPDAVIQVDTHIGDFAAEELRRYCRSAPAVILAPLGFPQVLRAGGVAIAEIMYAAYVITKYRSSAVRNDMAMQIVECIYRELPFKSSWSEEICSKTPTDIEGVNLYNGTIDKMGLSLWAVKWKQMIHLTFDDIYDSLDDFLRLYAEYDINADNQTDSDQLIEVPGPT